MVSGVGYETAPAPPEQQRASVSGDASAQTAQTAQTVAGAAQKISKLDTKPEAAANAVQPGVKVSISPEGAAATTTRAQTASVATSATSSATDSTAATPATVSPVKAFTYGALGLERPDQPQDERNAFYTAGKWLAAGLTIGGLISLLV